MLLKGGPLDGQEIPFRYQGYTAICLSTVVQCNRQGSLASETSCYALHTRTDEYATDGTWLCSWTSLNPPRDD